MGRIDFHCLKGRPFEVEGCPGILVFNVQNCFLRQFTRLLGAGDVFVRGRDDEVFVTDCDKGFPAGVGNLRRNLRTVLIGRSLIKVNDQNPETWSGGFLCLTMSFGRTMAGLGNNFPGEESMVLYPEKMMSKRAG